MFVALTSNLTLHCLKKDIAVIKGHILPPSNKIMHVLIYYAI